MESEIRITLRMAATGGVHSLCPRAGQRTLIPWAKFIPARVLGLPWLMSAPIHPLQPQTPCQGEILQTRGPPEGCKQPTVRSCML